MKNSLLAFLMAGSVAFSASAATETLEWSIASQPCQLGATGIAQPETYSVAVGMDASYFAGFKVVKIDAYLNLAPSSFPNISNTSVFMASGLAGTPDLVNAAVTPVEGIWKNLDNGKVTDEEVAVLTHTLENPYMIQSNALYFGYNLTVTKVGNAERYPILLDSKASGDGCYLKSRTLTEGQWESFYQATEVSGAPVIVVTLEREIYDNAAGVSFTDIVYAEAGKDFDALVKVINLGTSDLTEMAYTYTVGDGTPVEKTLRLDSPLASGVGAVYDVLFPIDAITSAGEYTLSLNVIGVNGKTNDASEEGSASAELDVFPYFPQHRPLMEEFTGLKCGYCPRGYAAMEYLRDTYPDDMVLICYHNDAQGADPMTVTNTMPVPPSNGVQSNPSAGIDRMGIVDPYYGDWAVNGMRDLGIVDDIFARAAKIAIADINVREVSVSPDSIINVTTEVTFMKGVESDRYRIGYVLTCNGLYNSTWTQTNYYSHDPDAKDAPLLDFFYKAPGSVSGLTFNDVAINVTAYMGIVNSLVDVTPGVPVSNEYSFDVSNVYNSQGRNLNSYLRIQRMVVNAFVIDKRTGVVVNACSFPVRNVYDSVETIEAGDSAAPVYYDLQGRRIANPERGIYIKSEGGKTSKVIL